MSGRARAGATAPVDALVAPTRLSSPSLPSSLDRSIIRPRQHLHHKHPPWPFAPTITCNQRGWQLRIRSARKRACTPAAETSHVGGQCMSQDSTAPPRSPVPSIRPFSFSSSAAVAANCHGHTCTRRGLRRPRAVARAARFGARVAACSRPASSTFRLWVGRRRWVGGFALLLLASAALLLRLSRLFQAAEGHDLLPAVTRHAVSPRLTSSPLYTRTTSPW